MTLISAPNDRTSVAYASPQVETLLGYSPDEWQDDPELFSKLLHQEDRDDVLAGVKKQTAGAAPRRAGIGCSPVAAASSGCAKR